MIGSEAFLGSGKISPFNQTRGGRYIGTDPHRGRREQYGNILNHLAESVSSPEKAGGGGSTPSLAIPFNSLQTTPGTVSFHFIPNVHGLVPAPDDENGREPVDNGPRR